MTQETPEPQSTDPEGDWLLPPEVPPGARVAITSVVEAEQFSPEVFRLLGQAMRELQESASSGAQAASRVTCPRLRSCNNYVGGCPNLSKCGNYSLTVQTTG